MIQSFVRALSALIVAIAATISAHALGGELARFSRCPGFEVAQVEGLSDYHLTSCCSKGCGGACCRCGSATGYLSDCSTPCSVGRAEEMKQLKTLSLPNGLVVVGRLIHPETKAPLSNETVRIVMPGGKTIIGRSKQDGTFRIELPGRSKERVKPTQVGDLPFVPSAELGKDEPKEYQLFLVPKAPTKATS